MEATLGPTYSVNVLVTTSGFGMVEAAAANMALNCRDAGLNDFFLDPSLDLVLPLELTGLDFLRSFFGLDDRP